MKANVKLVRKVRVFTDDFKKSLVREFESGKLSVPQLSKLHGIAPTQLYNWIYRFSEYNEKGYRVVEMKKSSSKKLKEQEARIKELEGMLGRKQILIDYLEELIDEAKSAYNIDLKKNSNTPQSGGSKPNKTS